MTICHRWLLLVVCAFSVAACGDPFEAAPAQWVGLSAAPSPVRLPDGRCFDAKRLPSEWRAISDSTSDLVSVGIPGPHAATDGPRYSLVASVGVSTNKFSRDRYRDYVQDWVEDPPAAGEFGAHNPSWDVPGFEAHAGDDGEIVFIGRELDATMECSSSSCTIHDGLGASRIGLDMRLPWSEVASARDKIQLVRTLVNAASSAC